MTSGSRSLERAEREAAPFPPLLLQAQRLCAGIVFGHHSRQMSGIGESFWQFRPYTPGEATTHIDWRQSAKRDSLFIRQLEHQAHRICWLWRDTSPSMDYASQRNTPTKAERADLLLLTLGILLAKSGERFGWYGADAKAKSHREGVFALAQTLTHLPDHQACFPGRHALARGAIFILVSDFLGPLDEIETGLRWLSSQGGEGFLIRILDPAERLFPFKGRIEFQDPETRTANPFLVERAENIQDAYRQKLTHHAARLREIALQQGWHYQDHDTSRPLAPFLHTLYTHLDSSALSGNSFR